ncbi:MAG: hypothetical protein GWP91_15315, partial [Rhodobacterales bacterium]|nr:hypothetical protein [Rhodobacterales bacterium]
LTQLERPWDRADVLSECFRATGDANCVAAEWARYDAVTGEDVVRVVNQYLVKGQKQTLSVIPRGDGGAMDGAVTVELP